jgi:hypothetical protein
MVAPEGRVSWNPESSRLFEIVSRKVKIVVVFLLKEKGLVR